MSPRLVLTTCLLLLVSACGRAGPASTTTVVSEPAPVAAEPTATLICRVDADCVVKDVGNCCGYYPACVHRDQPTFPERVQAECAKTGAVGICGYPEISACRCNAGTCEAAETAPSGTQPLQDR